MPGSLQSKQNLIKISRDDDTRSLRLGNKAHRIGPETLLTRGKRTFNPVQCCQYSDLSYVIVYIFKLIVLLLKEIDK